MMNEQACANTFWSFGVLAAPPGPARAAVSRSSSAACAGASAGGRAGPSATGAGGAVWPLAMRRRLRPQHAPRADEDWYLVEGDAQIDRGRAVDGGARGGDGERGDHVHEDDVELQVAVADPAQELLREAPDALLLAEAVDQRRRDPGREAARAGGASGATAPNCAPKNCAPKNCALACFPEQTSR